MLVGLLSRLRAKKPLLWRGVKVVLRAAATIATRFQGPLHPALEGAKLAKEARLPPAGVALVRL